MSRLYPIFTEFPKIICSTAQLLLLLYHTGITYEVVKGTSRTCECQINSKPALENGVRKNDFERKIPVLVLWQCVEQKSWYLKRSPYYTVVL